MSHLMIQVRVEGVDLFEERATISFLLFEGEEPANNYFRTTRQYETNCMNQRKF